MKSSQTHLPSLLSSLLFIVGAMLFFSVALIMGVTAISTLLAGKNVQAQQTIILVVSAFEAVILLAATFISVQRFRNQPFAEKESSFNIAAWQIVFSLLATAIVVFIGYQIGANRIVQLAIASCANVASRCIANLYFARLGHSRSTTGRALAILECVWHRNDPCSIHPHFSGSICFARRCNFCRCVSRFPARLCNADGTTLATNLSDGASTGSNAKSSASVRDETGRHWDRAIVFRAPGSHDGGNFQAAGCLALCEQTDIPRTGIRPRRVEWLCLCLDRDSRSSARRQTNGQACFFPALGPGHCISPHRH